VREEFEQDVGERETDEGAVEEVHAEGGGAEEDGEGTGEEGSKGGGEEEGEDHEDSSYGADGAVCFAWKRGVSIDLRETCKGGSRKWDDGVKGREVCKGG